MLCEYKESRWNDAIKANLDVLKWGKENGYEIIDTDNPFEDFGTAVGVPCNKEILLAYKHQAVGPRILLEFIRTIAQILSILEVMVVQLYVSIGG